MTKQQVVTKEFKMWLDGTSFSGMVKEGDVWDTADAWPSKETMSAARGCYKAFQDGDLEKAEELMHEAQAPFV